MVCMTHFFYNFICYTQSQKIRKPCNLKTFDSKKTDLSRKKKYEEKYTSLSFYDSKSVTWIQL